MFRKKIEKAFFILLFLFNGFNIFADGDQEENPNEISINFRNLINNGEIIPLYLLETMDKEKYDIIIQYIPINDSIEDYYFAIGFSVILNEGLTRYLNLEHFEAISELYEYENENLEIEYINYAIYYYEHFFNRYNNYRGNPTGKCFSIKFNSNHEFIDIVYWR